MAIIHVIHGPNLNTLGQREPTIYGHRTLASIDAELVVTAKENNLSLDAFQSNHEGALIDQIHQLNSQQCEFILLNPAAFTHTSIALRDAMLTVTIPFIEVHLSNVHKREPFRHHSYFSDMALGTIGGFGVNSYFLALQAAINHLKN